MGLTAEQIVAKVRRDPSGTVVLSHLLKGMNAHEMARLLIHTLPKHYLEEQDFDAAAALANCFRMALEIANETTKKAVATEFVRVLKQESESTIQTYETVFFTGRELAFLSSSDATLVKEHFFSRVGRGLSHELLGTMAGMERFIESSEINALLDPMIKVIVYGRDERLRKEAREYLQQAFWSTPAGNDEKWKARLGACPSDEVLGPLPRAAFSCRRSLP